MSCLLYLTLLSAGFVIEFMRRHTIVLPNRNAMIQDEDVAGSGGNLHRNVGQPPCYPIARTDERIAGICCPRLGQQVPIGLGHCQTGRLRWPSGPHNQPVTIKTTVPDAPPAISCSSRMILADTFLILS